MKLVIVISLTMMLRGIDSQKASESYLMSQCLRSVNYTFVVRPHYSGYYLGLNFNEELPRGSIINIPLQGLNYKKGFLNKYYFRHHKTISVELLKTENNLTLPLNLKDEENPQIRSLYINNEERCLKPIQYPVINRVGLSPMDITNQYNLEGCGRRSNGPTDVLNNEITTKPGDWPWHTVIMQRINAVVRYICGGTLISNNFILTAAHCVTVNGVPMDPNSLTVTLGKYKLDRGDTVNIDKKVFTVIVHPDYDPEDYSNDIALLELVLRAQFDEYIQAACVLVTENYNENSNTTNSGRVVGWGINHKNSLSRELYAATLTKVSAAGCIESNTFFSRKINEYNFCAGSKNGLSACNGDSGGGYYVFVPDTVGNMSQKASEKWYVHGISSAAVAIEDETDCDPRSNLLFTNVLKFGNWINQYLESEDTRI